jgi:hypothetical protein
MPRIIYRNPTYLKNIPIVRRIRSSGLSSSVYYNPSFKSILIETFFGMVFSHHIPVLMKSGGLVDSTKVIEFDSISNFFKSYLGKITFFLVTYTLLYYGFIPLLKKAI